MDHTRLHPGVLLLSLLTAMLAMSAQADHRKNQVEPVELLVQFQITAMPTGMTPAGEGIDTIGGPGYAPKRIDESGEISDKIDPERQVAVLEGAQITFGGAFSDLVVRFGCVAGSCKMTFKDGSVLESDAGVPLKGVRLISGGW